MKVDSVGIIAILSMSFITTRIVKTYTSVAKIPRVPVENQISTLSVVKSVGHKILSVYIWLFQILTPTRFYSF